MNKHLTYRTGNPVLTTNAFSTTSVSSETMTIRGTVDKTFLSLMLLMVTGYYSFMYGQITMGLVIIPAIIALIVAFITIRNKHWSPITVPIYAALQGLSLGGFSYYFNSLYDGIVLSAISITISILLAMLMVYRSGLIKPTENFKLGIAAATGGIFIVYIIYHIKN